MDFAEQHAMCVKSLALYCVSIGSVPPWFHHLTYDAQRQAIRR
jgi:hypothetical protein